VVDAVSIGPQHDPSLRPGMACGDAAATILAWLASAPSSPPTHCRVAPGLPSHVPSRAREASRIPTMINDALLESYHYELTERFRESFKADRKRSRRWHRRFARWVLDRFKPQFEQLYPADVEAAVEPSMPHTLKWNGRLYIGIADWKGEA
jgi:hypothetical protein